MFIIENGEIPAPLRRVIRSRKCVVFIGSGFSVGHYHSWPDLLNELCNACRVHPRLTRDSPVEEFLQAAQDAKSEDSEAYYQFLGGHFGRTIGSIPIMYHVLLSLPFDSYLTINFDHLLATGAKTTRIACKLYAYPELDRKHGGGRSIHHLHGFIEPGQLPVEGQIVLAKGEFEDAYSANSNLMNFLVPTLENEPIVFVGCRLREPAMKQVFDICKGHQLSRIKFIKVIGALPSKPPPRFILLPRPLVTDSDGEHDVTRSQEEMRELQEYYENLDIHPVWYDGQGDDHSALQTAFERLAGLRDIKLQYGWPGGGGNDDR